MLSLSEHAHAHHGIEAWTSMSAWLVNMDEFAMLSKHEWVRYLLEALTSSVCYRHIFTNTITATIRLAELYGRPADDSTAPATYASPKNTNNHIINTELYPTLQANTNCLETQTRQLKIDLRTRHLKNSQDHDNSEKLVSPTILDIKNRFENKARHWKNATRPKLLWKNMSWKWDETLETVSIPKQDMKVCKTSRQR